MDIPRRHWLLAGAVALGIGMLVFRENGLQAATQSRAVFLPVPQGSATLIQTPRGKTILIGGGKDLSLFREAGELLPFLERTIDLLILPDARMVNLATLTEITERFAIRNAIIPSPLPDTLTLHRDILAARDIPTLDVEWNTPLDLGEDISVMLINRGKSKPAIMTIALGNSRIDLPGSADDVDGDFSASVLRGIVWKDDLIETVIIRDTKEEAWIEDVAVRNVGTEGRVIVTLPEA